MAIDETSRVYPGVRLGKNVEIGPYCLIGIPAGGNDAKPQETVIGDGAIIRSHTIIYSGNRIGVGFATGHHAVIREENEIGDNVSIGTLSCIEHHVKIADGVRIHSQVFVPEFSILEERAWIGPNVVLTNARYPQSRSTKTNLEGPKIGRRAIIGANTTILPGVRIGEDAVVGSAALITKDLEAGGVYAGQPATFRRWKHEIEAYQE